MQANQESAPAYAWCGLWWTRSPHTSCRTAAIRRGNGWDAQPGLHNDAQRIRGSLRNNPSLFTVKEFKLLWCSSAVGSRPKTKTKKKTLTVFPFVCQERLLPASRQSFQLVDISSSVRPNSLLASTPTGRAKSFCSRLDRLQNKQAAQPKEKFLLFCSRHGVHGPAQPLFYTHEL